MKSISLLFVVVGHSSMLELDAYEWHNLTVVYINYNVVVLFQEQRVQWEYRNFEVTFSENAAELKRN